MLWKSGETSVMFAQEKEIIAEITIDFFGIDLSDSPCDNPFLWAASFCTLGLQSLLFPDSEKLRSVLLSASSFWRKERQRNAHQMTRSHVRSKWCQSFNWLSRLLLLKSCVQAASVRLIASNPWTFFSFSSSQNSLFPFPNIEHFFFSCSSRVAKSLVIHLLRDRLGLLSLASLCPVPTVMRSRISLISS